MFVNHDRVAEFAVELSKLPAVAKGLNFFHGFDGKTYDAKSYPDENHPYAVDFFFFACLHQHGFWHASADGYRAPMYATIDGEKLKGSDALWRSLKKALDRERRDFGLHMLAGASEHLLFERLFVHDDGPLPLPDPVTRLEMTRAYGRWFVERGTTPAEMVGAANLQKRPLEAFLSSMGQVPGFDSDPIQKKTRLLAMALMNRPEAFLKPADGEQLPPIVDYHLMRVALRLGLVHLHHHLARRNAARMWCDSTNETRIRLAVHEALVEAQKLSGVSSATLDFAMWSARRYCPEMSEPDCGKCRFGSVCAKNVKLFQPVFRTTAY